MVCSIAGITMAYGLRMRILEPAIHWKKGAYLALATGH